MLNVKAKEPFQFYTRLSLPELTGLKAHNLEQLLEHLKEVPGSCIFHHTHRFLQQHLYLSPEPPNDFAYWVANSLGDDELSEALASIDIVRLESIRAIRESIIATIETYLTANPQARQRFASENEAFYFVKSISFVFPTNHTATDLQEFASKLRDITIDSIYFHMFESRLRLEQGDNDFSRWIAESVGDKKTAERITMLDPYTCTAENLRRNLIKLVERGRL